MDNVSKDPEIPASHAEAEEALRMPPEHWRPRYSDEGIAERRPGLWTRLKAWFGRPAPKRDSYVSNVPIPTTAGSSHAAEFLPTAGSRVVRFIP